MPIYLTYGPHAAQRKIHEARDKRFRTVCTGRRFGKTLCLAAELMERGKLQAGDYGWVAPTYNVADRGIEAFRDIADAFITISGKAPTRVEFSGLNGPVRIWFLSADNPDNIRGFGFLGLVIDEAAMIPVDVWHYVLRPTIAQTLGWAVFVSTPKGHNWFYDLYARGLDPNEKDYASFTFPSRASPYFPEKEWEEAQRTLPEDVFRQEYLAEFLEDSAGVFRGVDACRYDEGAWIGGAAVAVPGDVVIGCDVAKYTDFTVLVAMDAETGRCFAIERFNQLDWVVQKRRIMDFARKYRGRVILDATGVGDPIYDDLRMCGLDVEGFKLTNTSKTSLIQRLSVAVEQCRVSWPGGKSGNGKGEHWDVLTAEMKRYEYTITPVGAISYSAPSGYHDDCVIALALANYRRWEMSGVGNMVRMGRAGRPEAGRASRVMLG